MAPAIPWRDASTNGIFTTASKTASRSTMTLPPQSPEISSTNFWPKPVDPRGFGATTTQPCAAHRLSHQRNDQPSSHAPCGPPWMRKTTGYFFAGSKAGGLISQYCTRAPPAPVVERLSGTENATSFRHERLSSVSAFACRLFAAGEPVFSSSERRKISGGEVRVASVKTRTPGPADSDPMSPPFFSSRGVPPARDTSKRSLLPSLSAVKYTVLPSFDSTNSSTDRSGLSKSVLFAFVFRS